MKRPNLLLLLLDDFFSPPLPELPCFSAPELVVSSCTPLPPGSEEKLSMETCDPRYSFVAELSLLSSPGGGGSYLVEVHTA